MRQNKPLVLRLIPALLLAFFIAACAQNDEPAPADPIAPVANTEVVVIAEDDPSPVTFAPEGGPSHAAFAFPAEDEQVEEAGVDEVNEDPTDKPNNDLAENPNYYPGGTESPHPNMNGHTSSVGLGGGIGGGGGRAASGGRVYRRVRGGKSVPHTSPPKPVEEWLKAHQNADGFWSADAHDDDSTRAKATFTQNIEFRNTGRPDGDVGLEENNVLVTALAMLAYVGAGYDHKAGEYRTQLRSAILYLRKIQDSDGSFSKTGEHPMRAHAVTTMAICEAYGLSGDQVLKPIVDRAIEFLLKHQLNDFGWGQGQGDLVTTTLSILALSTARVAGVRFESTSVLSNAQAFLDSLVFERDGYRHVRYSALREKTPRSSDAGDAKNLPLNEAMWVCSSLNTGTCVLSDNRIKGFSHLLVEKHNLPAWEDGKLDFLYWYFGSLALYQVGGKTWDTWEESISRTLIDHQRGYHELDKQAGRTDATKLAEHGSWDAVDIWSSEYGRVYSTTINALTLQVYYRYLRFKELPSKSDKDAIPDALEFDGLLRGQQMRRSNCGRLMARNGRETVGEFPLRHTNVSAKVSGTLAGTTVTQTFTNPYATAIEALYTFPLPGDSAINQFVMQIGERRIIGVMRPRAEAVRIYRDAKARGYTATLLTQNRPNVFAQSVANIEVGGEVKVEITYYQSLKYENGRFEYVFPMTLGPRYKGDNQSYEVEPQPEPEPEPEPLPKPEPEPDINKRRWIPHEGPREPGERDGVDDLEDFDVHALPPGMRSGMDIDLTIEIESGLPIDITRTRSVAHEILVTMQREGNAIVQLSKADAIPNRDFVLRWGIAGEQPDVGVLTHADERGKFLSLQIQPQLDPADADVTPREITFILDVSGSMSGTPSQLSKQVIRKVLDHLHPDDIFNIVYFAGSNGQVFESPQPNTPENINAAKDFLAKARASGGTEMLAGLQRALKAEHDPRHLQIYAFLTDGFIGAEDAIFNTIKNDGQDARFISFGIGSSVNRHLIDGIAEHGQGRAIYCLPRDDGYSEGAVQEFYNAIDMPVLCDVEIDWNGLQVEEVYPSKFSDLFAAQPLALTARYSGTGTHTINVNGRVGARHVSIPVEVNLDAADANPAIATLWARQKIADLSKQAVGASDQRSFEDAITQTALDFNLMSKYTSFVAVDESRIVGDGSPMTVWQPVEMPEGVTFRGDQRPAEQARVFEIPGWGLTVGETPDGRVIVVRVQDGTPGAEAGMQPGQVIEKINGLDVSTLDRLEALLLQTKAKIEVETRLTDEGQVVEAKFNLPELKAK